MEYRGLYSDRFLQNLSKRHHQVNTQTPGMFRILDYIFNFYPTRLVDFDRFTLSEMEDVMNEAHAYDCGDYGGAVDRNRYNAVHEYLRCIENMDSLHHSKKKNYHCDDDFI